MNEAKSKKEAREQLYDDVWSEPMIAVAKKHNLSDNGVRKRCKSLNVPIPPFGYWQKKKAGKEVDERPPLPPYTEIVLDDVYCDNDAADSLPLASKRSLELRDLDDMPLEQLSDLHGLALIVPESIESFSNWLDSIAVPGRVLVYDNLISKHKLEIEYREARDKAYPFLEHHIELWTYKDKVSKRKNIPVLPIEVSSGQRSRAYRIANTLLKSFQKLKARISVSDGEGDNIDICLLSSIVSFEIAEVKTKRRHLADKSSMQSFRPLYEEVYDGNIRINWQVAEYEVYSYYSRYSNSNKGRTVHFTYSDSKDSTLENQISLMILEVYKQCCENELKHEIQRKKHQQEHELEKMKQLAKEKAENLRELEAKKQVRKAAMLNGILENSNNWFKHKQLAMYADELEQYLDTFVGEEEAVSLLQRYIQLVKEKASNLNPISEIINEMRFIES